MLAHGRVTVLENPGIHLLPHHYPAPVQGHQGKMAVFPKKSGVKEEGRQRMKWDNHHV